MNISTKIRQVRELKGNSQEFVSKKLSISQSAYSQIERDDKNISIERIQTIAHILGINPLELINFNDHQFFNNYKNGNFGNNGNYYAYSENERMLYEKSIERLEREVDFLKETIEGFNKKWVVLTSYFTLQQLNYLYFITNKTKTHCLLKETYQTTSINGSYKKNKNLLY